MTGDLHVRTRDLPDAIQRVLRGVGYARQDISLSAAEDFSYQNMGADGQKAFVALVNLETGQNEILYGSWGGPGIGSSGNRVDTDRSRYPIPVNGAVLRGSVGGSVFARLLVNPVNMARYLPPDAALSPAEQKALEIMGGIISSYRAEEFERARLGTYSRDNAILLSLAAKKLIKITATGMQITTEGKTARHGL